MRRPGGRRGGAHRDVKEIFANMKTAIKKALDAAMKIDGPVLRKKRREKFLAMGQKGLS